MAMGIFAILMAIATVPLASSAGPPHPVQLPAAPTGTLDNREPIPYFIADGAGIPRVRGRRPRTGSRGPRRMGS